VSGAYRLAIEKTLPHGQIPDHVVMVLALALIVQGSLVQVVLKE
jgi:hypothetical protein